MSLFAPLLASRRSYERPLRPGKRPWQVVVATDRFWPKALESTWPKPTTAAGRWSPLCGCEN